MEEETKEPELPAQPKTTQEKLLSRVKIDSDEKPQESPKFQLISEDEPIIEEVKTQTPQP
jgi:hypothetical protein